MIQNTWWAEKYRPSTPDEYVTDADFKAKIKGWIEKGEINHLLLFSEKPGTGKTTLAKLIASNLDADVIYINASSENNVDMVRERITNFVSTISFRKWKIVICDEADFLTQNAQASLRNILETYSANSRFIFTANYVERLIPALRSRCTQFQIDSLPKSDILKRMMTILDAENVTYDPKDIAQVIKDNYPDQRAIITYLQDNSSTGKFILSQNLKIVNDYCSAIVDLFKTSKPVKTIFSEIRQLIANSKIRHFNDLYRYLYDELDEYCVDGKRGLVILALADGQFKDQTVLDKEINMMATIVNILNIIKG